MGFDRLIGHERPVRLLKAMLAGDRLPHGLLISGPTGVGKRTLALALARAVNCLSSDRPVDACEACLSCRKIEKGTHPDVEELAPEGKARVIKVDQVRELRSRFSYKPYEGRYRVFVIREADRMGEEAANALLKTLEEPPPQSLLVLTSPEESDLLPTILSRCMRLHLSPLNRDVVMAWLERERGLSGPRTRLLAAMSGGCLGRVTNPDPDALWEKRDEVIRRLKGLDPRGPETAVSWAEELAADKEAWPEVFGLMRFWYRDRMVLAGGGADRHVVNDDLLGSMTSSGGRRPEPFIQALSEIDRAEDALNRFIRPDLVFENLILNLADLGW